MRQLTLITTPLSAVLRVGARAWIAAMPSLSIGMLAITAALPLGLATEYRFTPALAPLAAIHFWAARRLDIASSPAMPAWLAFAAGLVVDVITSGPLGFWALIYLAGLAATLALSPHLAAVGLGRWLSFVVIAGLAAALQWLVASAYFATAMAPRPIALAAAAVVLCEPLLARLITAALPAAEPRASWARGGL